MCRHDHKLNMVKLPCFFLEIKSTFIINCLANNRRVKGTKHPVCEASNLAGKN